MPSFTLQITDSPVTPGRLNTQQTVALAGGSAANHDSIIVTDETSAPERIFNRTYAAAMDYQSGRGTLISKRKEMTLKLVFPITRLLEIEEIVDSLADYQIASFDGSDVDFVGGIRNFRMLGSNFPRDKIGCTHMACMMKILFQP